MLSRRKFGWMTGAAWVCSRGLSGFAADAGGVSFSVMMWTLKDRGGFEENLERVARAGYTHVELVEEFRSWSEEDLSRILAKMSALGLSVDAMAGMKSGFANPTGGDAFMEELRGLLPVAKRLGCRQVILLSGPRVEGAAAERQHQAAVETLRRAGEELRGAGVVAVIEPIDRLENPTIYLDGVTEAFEIVRAVASPNVKVLYDLYHEQRTHGNLLEKLSKNVDAIGLIHVADVPGRHQPGSGEVDFGNVYRELRRSGYRGVVAMEFYPVGDVVATLREAREAALGSMR